jgi:nonribosomal peptide synthetase protein BlmVII
VTQLHARIVETFLVDPPVRRIYQALDVASLAAAVDGLREERERAAIEAALDEIEASGAGR